MREVSAVRAEVSTATQVSVTKVSSRLQVSGVDDEHGQEVSTVRAGGVHGDSGGVGNKGEVSTARCHSGTRRPTGRSRRIMPERSEGMLFRPFHICLQDNAIGRWMGSIFTTTSVTGINVIINGASFIS